MSPGSKQSPRTFVRIRRHGAKGFGWEIQRETAPVEVHRSTRLFDTRLEALLDSARAAAALDIALVEPPLEDEKLERD